MYQMQCTRCCAIYSWCVLLSMMPSCNKPLFQKKYYKISQQLLLSFLSPPACMQSPCTAREFTCIFAALPTSIFVLVTKLIAFKSAIACARSSLALHWKKGEEGPNRCKINSGFGFSAELRYGWHFCVLVWMNTGTKYKVPDINTHR